MLVSWLMHVQRGDSERSSFRSVKESASKTRSILSPEPVTIFLPSSLMATAGTIPPCSYSYVQQAHRCMPRECDVQVDGALRCRAMTDY